MTADLTAALARCLAAGAANHGVVDLDVITPHLTGDIAAAYRADLERDPALTKQIEAAGAMANGLLYYIIGVAYEQGMRKSKMWKYVQELRTALDAELENGAKEHDE